MVLGAEKKGKKRCICPDHDPYLCYYLRYAEVYHQKYPNAGDDPCVDEVLPGDTTFCWCNCHDTDVPEGWMKKNDIRLKDITIKPPEEESA